MLSALQNKSFFSVYYMFMGDRVFYNSTVGEHSHGQIQSPHFMLTVRLLLNLRLQEIKERWFTTAEILIVYYTWRERLKWVWPHLFWAKATAWECLEPDICFSLKYLYFYTRVCHMICFDILNFLIKRLSITEISIISKWISIFNDCNWSHQMKHFFLNK